MNQVSDHLADAVLEALGLSQRPTHDLAGLRAVYGAWCRRVPFDNLRKLIAVRRGDAGPLPGDDPAEFLSAWLEHGTGGTCWAGSGALAALLERLGFHADRGLATMLVAPDLPPNHGTVAVGLPEGRFLVDTSIMTCEPLPVLAGEPSAVDHGAWGVQGAWTEDAFHIAWRPLHLDEPIRCRVDAWQVDRARYTVQHEATRRWSPFNFELTLNLVRGDGRLGVAHGQVRRIDAAGAAECRPLTDRVGFLVDEIGISEAMASAVPADVPTPPPPGSRAAGGGA